MSRERRVQRALELWRQEPVSPEDHDDAARREARVVASLRPLVAAEPVRRRARRRQRWTAGTMAALAIAASIVIAIGAARRDPLHELGSVTTLSASGTPLVVLRGSETRVSEPGSALTLLEGDEVSVAAGGSAELGLPSGARAGLSPSARARVARLGQSETVDLVRGTVTFRVPKLSESRSLSVVTPDARVVVHGTEFTVEVAPGSGTLVSVKEGLVAVIFTSGHVMLGPGERWRSAPVEPSTTPATEPSSATPRATPPPLLPSSAATPAPARSMRPADSLAEQNRLYRAALAAHDRGNDAEARARLDELLSRYPRSPLAPDARRIRQSIAK